MTDIEAIGRYLAEALKKTGADYVEARVEESQSSYITYRGRELESIGRNTVSGGNVRALMKGGWGFISFNSFDDLPAKVEMAVSQARFAGKEASQMAPVEPAVETLTELGENPAAIPLVEKKKLLDDHNRRHSIPKHYRPNPRRSGSA